MNRVESYALLPDAGLIAVGRKPSSKKRTANGSLKKGGVEDLLYKHSLRAGNSVLKGESGVVRGPAGMPGLQ